jgi:hypothetical protein
MADVYTLNCITTLDISASQMLINISEDKPKNAFVIAWPEDGSMPTYHSSTSDVPVILLRLQEFIHKYYNGDFT